MYTLQVICLVLTYSGLAVSTYDEHMTCGRSYKQMRLIQDLPCDFKHQNWCESPGISYPWSALRSFLLENQGLMRRMYGAIRQRTLLRAEFETNNINVATGRHSNNLFELSEKIPVDIKVNTNQKHPPTVFHQPIKTEGEKLSSSAPPTSPAPPPEISPHTHPEVTTQSNSPQVTTAGNGPAETTLPEKEDLGGFSSTTDNGLWTAEEVFTTLAMSEPTLVTGFGVSESTTLDSDDYEDVTSRIQDRIDLDAFLEQEPLPASDPIPAPPISVADEVGVNACPVKEEVVAPYWANNTRGEVLALLNLYPFEQYVHWEKCTYEHRQMFCRDGCRCEQQYRLHRMLAFDPNNECRGIFSDWFKFPSCCVCKCYNLTRNLYNSRKMAFQRDSSEIETDELIEEELLNNENDEPKVSQKQARSSHPEPELYEELKEPQTEVGDQEENMVKVESRRFEVPEDKTRTNIKPVEVSINSLTYKITGLKNFQKLFENVRNNVDNITMKVGRSKTDAPKQYSPAVLPNVQVREWTWPVRRFRASKRQPRTMP